MQYFWQSILNSKIEQVVHKQGIPPKSCEAVLLRLEAISIHSCKEIGRAIRFSLQFTRLFWAFLQPLVICLLNLSIWLLLQTPPSLSWSPQSNTAYHKSSYSYNVFISRTYRSFYAVLVSTYKLPIMLYSPYHFVSELAMRSPMAHNSSETRDR